jgi:hypothetical protein
MTTTTTNAAASMFIFQDLLNNFYSRTNIIESSNNQPSLNMANQSLISHHLNGHNPANGHSSNSQNNRNQLERQLIYQ